MILFIAWGTGGSEIFQEIHKGFSRGDTGRYGVNEIIDYEIIACSEYAKAKIPSAISIKEEEIFDYIEKKKPSLIVTERSNGLEFQKSITQYCVDNEIHNLVMTDIYFKNHDSYRKLLCDPTPHYITAVSESAYKEMLNIGITENNIFKTGNPAFDRLNDIRYDLEVKTKPKVVFLSQGGNNNTPHEELRGIFKEFYFELEQTFKNFTIDIKLHPMEEPYRVNWENDIIEYGFKNTQVLKTENKVDFLREHLPKYDLVIGKNSTLQVQGHIIGIPTIFYSNNKNIKKALKRYQKQQMPLDTTEEYNYYKHNITNTIEIIKNLC